MIPVIALASVIAIPFPFQIVHVPRPTCLALCGPEIATCPTNKHGKPKPACRYKVIRQCIHGKLACLPTTTTTTTIPECDQLPEDQRRARYCATGDPSCAYLAPPEWLCPGYCARFGCADPLCHAVLDCPSSPSGAFLR